LIVGYVITTTKAMPRSKGKAPRRLFDDVDEEEDGGDGLFVPEMGTDLNINSNNNNNNNNNSNRSKTPTQHSDTQKSSMYYPIFVFVKVTNSGRKDPGDNNILVKCISCLGGGDATHVALYDVVTGNKYTADLYRKQSYSAPMDDLRKFSNDNYRIYGADLSQQEHDKMIEYLTKNENKSYDTCMSQCAFWDLCCPRPCTEKCCTYPDTQTCARYVNGGLSSSGLYGNSSNFDPIQMIYCETGDFVFPTSVERNMEKLPAVFNLVSYEEMVREINEWRTKFGIVPVGVNLMQGGDGGPDFLFMT
jgi:hypothetical protein